MNRRLGVLLAVMGVTAGVFSSAHGAGFALIEESASGMGRAFAGSAAVADDASTVFFNPAGMTRLQGTRFTAALHIIEPSTEFSDRGSFLNPNLTGGTPVPGSLTGGDGGDAGTTGFVPNFYYVRDLTADLKFGLGISSPFGLVTEYDDGWVGRYHALKSDLLTVNINPAFAFKASNTVSLGVGLNAMYVDAELTSALDMSTICIGSQGPATCAGLGLATPGNPATDGNVNISGDDWAWGYNLGVLFEPDPATRIGVSYRSKVDVEIRGSADFSLPAAATPLTATGLFQDTGIDAKVTLPENVSLSIFRDLGPQWSIGADITWTRWSRFEALVIEFDNPVQPDSVTPENWEDSYRYSIGFDYRRNAMWTYRFGVAYDETPVPNAEDRTPRIADNDRTWIAGGFSYAPSASFSFDAGLAYLIIDDTDINNTDITTGHQLVGEYESDVWILSGQANWTF